MDLNFDDLPSERALGIKWNTSTDTLQFMTNATFDSHTIDRRGVLSAIASLYDPFMIHFIDKQYHTEPLST